MDRDFLLVQKMKNGNEDAMEVFVRRYYPAILRYCGCHVCSRELAEDLTQETFERFFRSLGGYQHIGKAQNYLYVIAGNLCKNSYRMPPEVTLGELPEAVSANPAEAAAGIPADGQRSLLALEQSLDLQQALSHLPEEFREVLLLHYFQELKLKEIAEILNISLPLVKYRLHRGRELFRQIYREEDLP